MINFLVLPQRKHIKNSKSLLVGCKNNSQRTRPSPRAVMQRAPTILELYNKKCHVSINDYSGEKQNRSVIRQRIKPFCDIKMVNYYHSLIDIIIPIVIEKP